MSPYRALLKTKAYLGGKWVEAASGDHFPVVDPARQATVAEVANCGAVDAERAVEAGQAAFQTWSRTTAEHRAMVLQQWHDRLLEHQDSLAALITLEMGKPLAEARGEVAYAASFLRWFAEEARRVYGEIIPASSNDKRLFVLKQPVGVTAAITPWNFPVAMIARKVAPALAAGCSMIVKPAEDTPLSALAMAHLFEGLDAPAGVFNVVPTQDPKEVGKVLTTHSAIRKISFTGSTATGKKLMKQASDSVKRVSLELGGNAPFIVFADADMKAAAEGAMVSKYRNGGQTCVCTNRIFLESGSEQAFLDEFLPLVKQLKVGPGMEEGNQVGPLINEDACKKVETLVGDAVRQGAEVVHGGGRHELGGTYFQPSVLRNANPSMRISQEEIFGPVSVLSTFKSEGEVIQLANDTPYGLAAYFYSRDTARVWRVAEQLEYGMVGVNTGLVSTAQAPFGGVKESGIGREGSHHGIDEYLEIKYVCLGGLEP
ncbi:MAG: NAD-dependent succinate-semialdehyde dehydrogenase [Candidatus Eisenbacteria bacterium]|uniref:NAD-dependent succinate-semialdehyde dehydrogenase n=1 Tax=Eiseniibacteriota bacterium TaxID=2212470 RepID=A0A7Y2EAT6_UNCEI|nr:NAD-dependent succinate-semialdehyde dehydrogenase [Candidatus Eisenbacteria bacterium]